MLIFSCVSLLSCGEGIYRVRPPFSLPDLNELLSFVFMGNQTFQSVRNGTSIFSLPIHKLVKRIRTDGSVDDSIVRWIQHHRRRRYVSAISQRVYRLKTIDEYLVSGEDGSFWPYSISFDVHN